MSRAPPASPTLSLEAVTLRLGTRTVVSDVSVAIAPGEILAVLGPNGAGKSTLLRAAAGLLAPAAGAIRLADRDLGAWDRAALGRSIAFLPQHRTVHWPLTVRRIVALGRLPHRHSPAAGESAADRAAIGRALSDADIAHLADRSVTELSGGERARVLLARTLAQQASILIADEPTAGLDPAHQLAVYAHLQSFAGGQRSVLIALHDLTAAMRLATRVLVLADGRLAALGAPREVLTPELIAQCYGIRASILDHDTGPIVLPLSPLA